jgi:hypothetical protein
LRQEVEQDAQVDLGPLGAQQFNNTIVIESTQKTFKGEDPASSRIEQVMNRLKMDVRQGEAVLVEFDSSDQNGEAGLKDSIAPLLGKPLTILISDRGEVLGITGFAEIFSSLSDAGDPKLMQSLKQGLSEESVTQMMQMSLPTFPDREIAEGDTWTHDNEFNNPMFGTMRVKSEYTVQAKETCAQEECLVLGVDMDQTLELDSGIFEQLKAASGASLNLNIDEVQGNGTIWIATADGVTLKSEIRQQIKLTMKVSGEGQDPIEMHMAADQKILQNVER